MLPITRRYLTIALAHLGMFTFATAIGYLFEKFKIHEKAYTIFENIVILPYIMLIMIIIIRAMISTKPIDTQIDWLIAPCYIIALSYLIKILPNGMKSLLKFLGEYSIYIWLTHTFFIYYYFQKFVMLPRELFLIYLFVLSICTGLGIMMNYIAKKITKVVCLR